jgi:CheY-like chemotaxis protein
VHTSQPLVLVVEDDPPLRALIAEVLREELGAAPSEAADGRAAVRALVASRPNLVVLDLRMPGADGLTVLRWLATRPPAARPPVLCVTAAPADEQAEAVRLGCTACLTKPFDLLDLAGAARALLEATPPLDEPAGVVA